ncbi:MAG TPA: hypothetical protein VF763_03975 [Candidatus Limnocylindrales bacterium]
MVTSEGQPDLTARLAVLEERLVELERERERERTDGLEALLGRIFPAEVRGHMRAARKEQLLAVRSMLDHWIDRLDRAPEDRVRRRESITLE